MIDVFIENDVKDLIKIKNTVFKKLIKKIFKDHKQKKYSVAYIISNDKKLSQLKKDFFNKNVLTDVISFNLEEPNKPIEGEVYISLERIKENASIFKQNFSTELCRIVIHGTLHLIGFDDRTIQEKKIMTDLENMYLETIPNIIE